MAFGSGEGGFISSEEIVVNCDVPTFRCWVRSEFISDRAGEFDLCYCFAVQSIKGRCLGFHVMTQHGAHYRNVPIHALCTVEGAQGLDLSACQLWDCFSSRPVVHVFDYLRDHQCFCWLRGLDKRLGSYLFTVDWLPDSNVATGFTLIPEQNKCAHVIELVDGNIVALPTNRIAWVDGYFVGGGGKPELQRYATQDRVYSCEDYSFDVSGSEDYLYRSGDE